MCITILFFSISSGSTTGVLLVIDLLGNWKVIFVLSELPRSFLYHLLFELLFPDAAQNG